MSLLFVLLASLVLVQAQSASRLPGSPYPVSSIPTGLSVIDITNFSDEQVVLVETLAGVTAQTKPEIYMDVQGNGAHLWLEDLISRGVPITANYSTDLWKLVGAYSNAIEGYVIYDDNSVNIGISLCGILKAIAITATQLPHVKRLGIPQLMDVRGQDQTWFYQNYEDRYNKKILSYQDPSKDGFLADYSTFGQMITLFENSNGTFTEEVFSTMKAKSAIVGWGGSELGLVSLASQYSMFVHAADFSRNLAILSNFDGKPFIQKGHSQVETQEGYHTVCFLMTDGDNIQWLLNNFATNPSWYASPSRGQLNLGWTLSPALSELAPTLMSYIYENAANNTNGKDFFVGAPSGIGYMYPEVYPNLNGFANLSSIYTKKSDMRIINIIGNNPAPEYVLPYVEQDNVDAIFFYEYANYAALNGSITWQKNKPIIGGRYNLWDIYNSPQTLAQKLNALPTDITSSDGYSLIPVHVWTMGVDDILKCISLLNKNIRVVTPEEFVQLIVENVKH